MRKGSDDKFSNDEFGVEGPVWADGKTINEAIFCEEFLGKHNILFSGGSFFTTEGRVSRFVQIANEYDPKLLTDFGIITSLRLTLYKNA